MVTGRLGIGITERLSSQGELFTRKKLALMFNNSNKRRFSWLEGDAIILLAQSPTEPTDS